MLKQEVGEGVSFITRPPSKKGFCRNERLAWREKALKVSWTGITVELQCLFLQGSEKLADINFQAHSVSMRRHKKAEGCER